MQRWHSPWMVCITPPPPLPVFKSAASTHTLWRWLSTWLDLLQREYLHSLLCAADCVLPGLCSGSWVDLSVLWIMLTEKTARSSKCQRSAEKPRWRGEAVPHFAHKKVGIHWIQFLSSFRQNLCITPSRNFGFCKQCLLWPSRHPVFKTPFLFCFPHFASSSSPLPVLSSSSVPPAAPVTVDAAPWVSTGRVCVASCRRDWPWLGPLRPQCSSWQDRSWELFNSRRIGGSASHRHPMSHTHTHTHALVHTTLPHSQDSFACLPPIRPVCFLSPHYTAMRGATALAHFQIYKAVSDREGQEENCRNWIAQALRLGYS